jgi:hypothetical protein
MRQLLTRLAEVDETLAHETDLKEDFYSAADMAVLRVIRISRLVFGEILCDRA